MFWIKKKFKKEKTYCFKCAFDNSGRILCNKTTSHKYSGQKIYVIKALENDRGKCKHYKSKTERNPQCQTQPTKES